MKFQFKDLKNALISLMKEDKAAFKKSNLSRKSRIRHLALKNLLRKLFQKLPHLRMIFKIHSRVTKSFHYMAGKFHLKI
jgi:hypothetical protein